MAEPPKKICVFGGSFNPPHICHTLAAVWATETLDIDEIWWVPVYEHAFGKQLLAWEHRLQMVRAAIDPFHKRMKLCTIEAEFKDESRTIDTLRALNKKHPNTDFSLLVGADLIEEIPSWKDGKTLQETVQIYTIGREGYDHSDASDLVLPNISSTALRRAISEERREFYASRISRAVVELIDEHTWYRE